MASTRPSLGSVLLNFRQKYRHGVRTAYFRDVVRPQILSTPAMECGADRSCEIHVLTSSADWLNLVWALKSFYFYSQRKYALCIHDDGTLEPGTAARLLQHFSGARIISRVEADTEIEEVLRSYPNCLKFRQTNPLSPKLFDFAYHLRAPRLLLIDSDILFFSPPEELLRRIDDPAYQLNSVNADVSSAYTLSEEDAERQFNIRIQPRLNSGLGLIHRESMRFEWMEEFLSFRGLDGFFWRIEQTIYALCSSRFGVELLPEDYAVRLTGDVDKRPCRHYVGGIRHLMYSEGIRNLMKSGFLDLLHASGELGRTAA